MNNNMHRRVLLVQLIEDIIDDLNERVSTHYGRYIYGRLEEVPSSEDTSELLLIIQDIISDRTDQGDRDYVSHIRERLEQIKDYGKSNMNSELTYRTEMDSVELKMLLQWFEYWMNLCREPFFSTVKDIIEDLESPINLNYLNGGH